MALYWISVDAIALVGATAKSVLELGTPSADRARVVEWWYEFDGTTATNTPVKVELGRFSAGVTTATTLAGFKVDPADGAAAVVAKHSTSTEGAGTVSDVINRRCPPTSGFHYVAPLGREVVLAVSTFWRMRLTAAQAVNVTVGVMWEE